MTYLKLSIREDLSQVQKSIQDVLSQADYPGYLISWPKNYPGRLISRFKSIQDVLSQPQQVVNLRFIIIILKSAKFAE